MNGFQLAVVKGPRSGGFNRKLCAVIPRHLVVNAITMNIENLELLGEILRMDPQKLKDGIVSRDDEVVQKVFDFINDGENKCHD